MKFLSRVLSGMAVLAVLISLQGTVWALVPVVKVVPWVGSEDPMTTPHDTYAGKAITLKGTSSLQGPTIFATWDFGDGSPVAGPTNVTNKYNVSATHVYVGAVGTNWTAILTITDTSDAGSASKNYLVTMRANNLASNVNVAIDEGLWYLHRTEQRYTLGTVDEGDWDNLAPSACGAELDCDNVSNSQAINASNVQAFEVKGHLESGSANNPYTETVARALKRLFTQLGTVSIGPKTIKFPAPPSCPAPPCTYNPDTFGDGGGVAAEGSVFTGRELYQAGQFMDAIVASGTPAAVTTTGPAGIVGKSYKEIVQRMANTYEYCQYGENAASEGGWRYNCNDAPDSSACQWAAIGLIAASRAFGISIPAIVLDANKVWINFSEDPPAPDRAFGYTDSGWKPWGPYADTPSGMVQMAMDGVGRGDPHWDGAESFIRDNFDNVGGASTNLKAYTYGLFSFVKSMRLHSPGGVLTPIVNLQTTSGSGKPPIDWYSAEASSGATSDGVARTLVNRQNADGSWYGHSFVSNHFPFETGWSVIILSPTVFVSCVTDLGGRGTPSGVNPARIDLTWTGIPNVDHYDVLRGTTMGGPYTKVGSSTSPAFSDRTGLLNGHTYFYVLQPINASSVEICQSNEAKVTIPNGR